MTYEVKIDSHSAFNGFSKLPEGRSDFSLDRFEKTREGFGAYSRGHRVIYVDESSGEFSPTTEMIVPTLSRGRVRNFELDSERNLYLTWNATMPRGGFEERKTLLGKVAEHKLKAKFKKDEPMTPSFPPSKRFRTAKPREIDAETWVNEVNSHYDSLRAQHPPKA